MSDYTSDIVCYHFTHIEILKLISRLSCVLQAALKSKIEVEFTRLMAQGGMSPNEAALIAVKNVATAQTSLQA